MLNLGFKYKDRIIFKNIFLICFGLPLLCVMIAGVIGFTIIRNNQLREKERNVQDILNVSRVMIDNQFDAVAGAMENLQNDVYVKRLLTRDEYIWDDDMSIAARQIVNNIAINSDFHSIYLIGNGDYILKFTNPRYPLNEEADKRMISHFYGMDFSSFKTYKYTDIYGKPKTIISLSSGEINSTTGVKTKGILISFDIGKVMDSILSAENEGEFYVLTDENTPIYSYGSSPDPESIPAEIFETTFAKKEGPVSGRINLNNESYFCSRVALYQGYCLYDFIPYKILTESADNMLLVFVLIVLALGLILFVISYLMSKWAYNPIDLVVKNTSKEFSENIPSKLAGTELGAVAQSYHYMMRHLNELNDDKELTNLAEYLKERASSKKLPEWILDSYGKPGLLARCLCIRISDIEDFQKNNTEEAITFMNQTMTSLVKQYMQDNGQVIVVPVEQEYMAVILIYDDSKDDDLMIEYATQLQSIIKEMLSLSVDIGISSEKDNLQELHNMYQMARAATAYRFLTGIGVVITEDMMAKRALMCHEVPDTQAVTEAVKKNDQKGFADELDRVFDRLKDGSIQMAKDVIFDMAVDMQNYSNSLLYHFDSLNAQDYEKLSKQLEQYKYIGDLKNYFIERAEGIWDVILKAQKKGKEDIADKAVAYLDQNYSDVNINAGFIADMFHITPSYFSRLFNEKTGYAFPDYLATIRIEKAKQLLLENDNLSIQEICDRVGYSNPSYFTATFKKKFGITPGQFRKNKHSGEV